MPDILFRNAAVAPATVDDAARTVDVVWSTGAAVRRFDLDGPFTEVLSLDPAHVDLSRLIGASVLDAHQQAELRNVLGVVLSANVDGQHGTGTLQFSARPDVEPIWQDVRAGILRHISVGYTVERWQDSIAPSGERVRTAIAWTPIELSFVPTPADPGASTRTAGGTMDPEQQQTTTETASEPAAAEFQPCAECRTPNGCRSLGACVREAEAAAGEPPPAAEPPPVDAEALVARAQATERQRIATINDLTHRLGLERSFADGLVRRGVAIGEARRLILDQVASAADRTRSFPHVATPLGGRDERVTRRDAVSAALLHRYSPTLFPLSDAAREYRGMTLLELAREFLGAAGVNVRGASRDEIATRALHSTSDFREVLAAVTNKTLRQAYETYPRTFTPFCRQVLATDFKAMHRVQIGEAPQLLKVSEGGEFKRGTIAESKESYRIETYGRVVAITRQVLINDDLDAFTRIPAMYGTAIATLESDVVWGILTANAAMADGVTLFHANHKNLAGAGAAISVTTVGEGRAAMAKQTGLDKKTVLNIRPAFLIVPAALELTAEQLLAQNITPAKAGDVVPQSIRTLAPIAEPRLDVVSATAWYLAANPAQIDTVEYAYLEGQQGAYVETRNGFDVDGVEIKCRLDFGAKAIDWRGLYKNAGA